MWVLVALAGAGAQAGYETLQKRLMSDMDALRLSYVTSVLGTVLLMPVAMWVIVTQPVSVTPTVVVAVLVAIVANVLALYAFLIALSQADLSVVSPLRQSTPLLVASVEPFILSAQFAPGVVIGALAATTGGYVILVDGGLSSPLSRITEIGPLLALGTAGLYAVASVAARFVVVRVPPLLFTLLLYFGMAVSFTALIAQRDRALLTKELITSRFLAVGAATTLRSVLIFAAFSLAAAARVTVVLRASLVLTVLAGGTLFGERDVTRRLAGTGLIILGVWLAI